MASKRQKKKQSKLSRLCPLCGISIDFSRDEYVVGRSGRAVCGRCLHIGKELTQPVSPVFPYAVEVITPEEMICQLDKRIIGQDRAKRAVAVALWKQQLRAKGHDLPSCSLMLYGPTGCGKTALIREAAKIAGLPFLIFDTTTLTENGYRGRDAADIIKDLVDRFGMEKSKHGIVFLDEVDKLAATKGNEYRASFNRGTQHSLLKLLEGTDVVLEKGTLSSSNILFVFGGAFTTLRKERDAASAKPHKHIGFDRIIEEAIHSEPEELTIEDFVSYGMESELMGRIGSCISLQPLSREDLKRILLRSELSVYRQYQSFFAGAGHPVLLTDSEIDRLVDQAAERGLGARGLNTLVEAWIEPKLFELSKEVPYA